MDNYEIEYRVPHTGASGIVIIHTAAKMEAERSRLEGLSYVVTDVAPIPLERRRRTLEAEGALDELKVGEDVNPMSLALLLRLPMRPPSEVCVTGNNRRMQHSEK